MNKRPIGYVSGKPSPLDKKAPKNPKFSHVSTKLKTGLTVNDIQVISDSTIAKRKGELFRRITPSALANLLREERNFESVYNMATEDAQKENIDDNESIYSLQSQDTKISAVTSANDQVGLTADVRVLLLDLRESEEFDLYHIKEAISFPGTNILRDKYTPELYRLKNKEGKLIVVYHFEERTSIPYGTALAQKGFENAYLLSGGIEAFLEEYSSLCEGKLPSVQKKLEEKKLSKRSNYKEPGVSGNFHIEDKNFQRTNDELVDSDTISVVKSVVSTTSKRRVTRPNTRIGTASKEGSTLEPRWMP